LEDSDIEARYFDHSRTNIKIPSSFLSLEGAITSGAPYLEMLAPTVSRFVKKKNERFYVAVFLAIMVAI